MLVFIVKTTIAALAIAFSSWLAGRKPELAGFIIALPLTSLLALAFSYAEYKDAATSIAFAKSILIGVPVSWLFFLPFFLAEKFDYGFLLSYAVGLVLLIAGFFIHRYINSLL
jgi:hypothetical protein